MQVGSLTSLAFATGLAVTMAFSPPARASSDHDRARQALQAGEILPLDRILAVVAKTHPGQILEVELDQKHSNGGKIWRYEIKGIAADGRLFKLKIDARTGEILQSQSRAYDRGHDVSR